MGSARGIASVSDDGQETQYRVKRLEKAEYGNVKMAENSIMAVSVSLVVPNF